MNETNLNNLKPKEQAKKNRAKKNRAKKNRAKT